MIAADRNKSIKKQSQSKIATKRVRRHVLNLRTAIICMCLLGIRYNTIELFFQRPSFVA